jgi:transglutaminase-like putative cysteine protease
MNPLRLRHIGIAVLALAFVRVAAAANAPAWMHAQIGVELPAHDDDAAAVVLYSESALTVKAAGKMRRLDRMVYKILRPDGERHGVVPVLFDEQTRIVALRGWSIPVTGADYEAKAADFAEVGLGNLEGAEFITDVRTKLMRIPGATVGSIVGYEVESELRPYFMNDEWGFQDTLPVREARYTLQLPPGWTYKAFWLNHGEVAPVEPEPGQWRWTVYNVPAVKLEDNMPPWRGVAGKLMLSLLPPEGQQHGFQSWKEFGLWYQGLTNGRRDASSEIRQKVQELTAAAPTQLAKIKALADFVQADIRYVAIELGIGGLQPRPAADIYKNRYGDCKDKTTLLAAMLKEIGVESHYVIIHTERGSVTPTTPPNLGFNHAILAIRLPAGIETTKLPAVTAVGNLGKVLFFDPTSQLVPFGSLPGELQANYGVLVTPAGGELVQLPQPPADANGVKRTAKLTLSADGSLRGDVEEAWVGDAGASQRYGLRNATRDVDQIKPVESNLSHSLATFRITRAATRYLRDTDQPLEWHYSIEIDGYAKRAGDLLLVRPRVFDERSSALLNTREPRRNAIEFRAPERDTDVFEITLPAGYVVDELPIPVDVDLGFAAYHSRSEASGSVLRYTRSFELKQLSVPVEKAADLKQFYSVIYGDERQSAVLRRTTP